MTAKTKVLTENFNCISSIPRKFNNKTLSTNGKFVEYFGTYQQVVDALDAEKIPEHKIKGFQWTGIGTCSVIVHKH